MSHRDDRFVTSWWRCSSVHSMDAVLWQRAAAAAAATSSHLLCSNWYAPPICPYGVCTGIGETVIATVTVTVTAIAASAVGRVTATAGAGTTTASLAATAHAHGSAAGALVAIAAAGRRRHGGHAAALHSGMCCRRAVCCLRCQQCRRRRCLASLQACRACQARCRACQAWHRYQAPLACQCRVVAWVSHCCARMFCCRRVQSWLWLPLVLHVVCTSPRLQQQPCAPAIMLHQRCAQSSRSYANLHVHSAGSQHSQQATRHARRIYVGGLPPSATEPNVTEFFNNALAAIGGNVAGPGAQCTMLPSPLCCCVLPGLRHPCSVVLPTLHWVAATCCSSCAACCMQAKLF